MSPRGWGGQSPLHFCLRAVAVNGGQDFIFSLIEAYPEAASCKDSYGMTALRLACENGFSSVVVQRLYQVNPEAVMDQDGW
jgi:ankyrin repeat protein